MEQFKKGCKIRLTGYNSDSVTDKNNKVRYKCPKIEKSLKEKLLINGVRCYICEIKLTNLLFTWDHIYPKSKGGKKVKECCIFCNNEKGAMEIPEYIEFLQSLPYLPITVLKIKNLNALL